MHEPHWEEADGNHFPPSLTSLSFLESHNRCAPRPERASASSLVGCPQLTELELGNEFEQPLSSFRVPSSLTRISGVYLSQLDTDWMPPGGLLEMHMARLASDKHLLCSLVAPGDLRWPPQLRFLELPIFSDGADYSKLALPESLESMLVHVEPGVQHARWPVTLCELKFVDRNGRDREWDLSLTQLPLPPRLRLLELGMGFRQPIRAHEIEWPGTLETLILGCTVNEPLDEWTPPSNLRLVSEDYRLASWSTKDLRVPNSLRRLRLDSTHVPPLRFSPEEWPALEYLDLQGPPVEWSNMLLPPRLVTLRVRTLFAESTQDSEAAFLRDFRLPSHVQYLMLDLVGDAMRRLRADLPPTCALISDFEYGVDND
jgi:hypothetical protein